MGEESRGECSEWDLWATLVGVWKTKEVKNSADCGLSAHDVSGGKNIKHVS